LGNRASARAATAVLLKSGAAGESGMAKDLLVSNVWVAALGLILTLSAGVLSTSETLLHKHEANSFHL
jgi:hypothetical protein